MKVLQTQYPTIIGVAFSIVTALAVALLFARVSRSSALPLLFVLVQVAIAARFGVKVSVIGSLAAAAIFATVVYAPTGSLYVENAAARGNIAWMILASIALSYLLLPDKSKSSKRPSKNDGSSPHTH